MAFLIEAWRQACRHSEAGDSVVSLAPLIASQIPLQSLLVQRFDATPGRLHVVAAVGRGLPALGTRAELPAEASAALLDWSRAGAILHASTQGPSPLLALLVPAGLSGDVLAGPLREGEQPVGVVVLVGQPGAGFGTEHEEVLASLLEPIAVALQNDRRVLELVRLREAVEADNRALLTRLQRDDISDSIVGAEAGLAGVMEQVGQVAPTEAPVLILGETGSGKEVIARSIHERSRRAAGPVVRVNCGAIPPELVDSELFGHERGSFTGAVNARKGWFERADGGTLFLDEIGELPLAAQVRLLRILQDGSFERVGGQRTQTVDVRLVAATHRELQDMVAQGGFRQDLWYRISVFPIRLPALRERRGDIAALARHFAQRAGLRLGGVALQLSPDELAQLAAYDWPGNVRELASVIERATILGGGRRLDIAAALGGGTRTPAQSARGSVEGASVGAAGLQPGVAGLQPGVAGQQPGATSGLPALAGAGSGSVGSAGAGAGAGAGSGAAAAAPPGVATAAASLDAAMIGHIESVLAATGGRIEGPSGTAARLGINPHTLRARMRKLGIDWSRFRA